MGTAHRRQKIPNDIIIYAVIITIISSIIITAFAVRAKLSANPLIFLIIYSIIHPLIARVLYGIYLLIAKGIDEVYEIDPSNKWSDIDPGKALILSSLWPITMPFMIPIAFIGLIFGWLFKKLF